MVEHRASEQIQVHFEDTFTARDCKRHFERRFDVPPGAAQIDILFCFEPHRVQGMENMLTLTVFGAGVFRGAGHRGGAVHQVQIGAAAATPGYLPGPLPAGAWVVQIDTHMIMPGEPVHCRLDVTVTLSDGAAAAPAPAVVRRLPARGPGWRRGELHSHTHHSDAGDRTVAELVQMARQAGLDFLFLTDHNTTAGLPEVEAAGGIDLLTAGGLELTTFWGHALVLGTRRWVDWRVRPGAGAMAAIAAATYAADQAFIIAHPHSQGDPACTGCAWRYGELMPGAAQIVEVWNGPWAGDSNNEAALALWYDWLNQGLRIVATAGSDTHGNQDYAARPGFTVIYAEELTEPALIAGLRAGRVYLSSGPRLAWHATEASGSVRMIGDTVGQPALFTLTWEQCPPGTSLRVIVDGRTMAASPIAAEGMYTWSMAPRQGDWLLVELRGRSGELLAVTNPIYLAE